MARATRSRTLEAEIKATPEYKQVLRDAAGEARKNAIVFEDAARGPWMPPRGARNPGQTIIVRDFARKVVLMNIDHAGHLLEWGSINNPPHAPLRRGVLAAGLRFVPLPKHSE